jgi:hypothetical protein
MQVAIVPHLENVVILVGKRPLKQHPLLARSLGCPILNCIELVLYLKWPPLLKIELSLNTKM